MGRIAYVDGRYVPMRRAMVHMEDRGYRFADGVYEGIALRRGRIIDLDGHLLRLDRSLAALQIPAPMGHGPMTVMLNQLVRLNRITNGFFYLQVTRGVADRDHFFPKHVKPVVTATLRRLDFRAVAAKAETGIAAISLRDERWPRRDIKSISLLPNVLAKQKAREAGAYEAMQVDADGFVTEGAATNMWMVDKAGTLITRAPSHDILDGITRQRLLKLAHARDIKVEERPFTVGQALAAREVMLSSTTVGMLPIVTLDGQPINDGKPGPLAQRLFRAYWDYMVE